MKRLALFLLSLFFVSNVIAAKNIDVDWDQLGKKAAVEGERTDSYWGVFKTLKHQKNLEIKNTYQVNYFSAVGGDNEDGSFSVGRYESVNEVWRMNSQGNWGVKQWLFKIDLQSNVRWYAHKYLLIRPDGLVLKDKYLSVTDEEADNKWNVILRDWYKTLH